MGDLIKIGNQRVATKEFGGQRVVTFKDIDMVHERPDGTARKRFNDNKKHFVEKEDYFVLNQPSEIRTLGLERPQGGVPEKITLITEQGYLMLVKSFTDDLAWEVQRQLVNCYFRKKEDPFDGISPELKAVLVVDKRITDVEQKVGHLENTMNIDYAQQKRLKNFASEIVVNALGGKDSRAYKHRADDGSRISSQVFSRFWHDFDDYFEINAYANLPRVRFDEALEYINRWQPPTNMQLEIGRINRSGEM